MMSDQDILILKSVRDKYNSLLNVKPHTKSNERRKSKLLE